jgi:hypothetical protein
MATIRYAVFKIWQNAFGGNLQFQIVDEERGKRKTLTLLLFLQRADKFQRECVV